MKISLAEAIDYIKSDLYRYTGRFSLSVFARNFIKNRSFKYSFWFRLTQTKNIVLRGFAIMMHNRLSKRYGIQIPRYTKIGYGLYIGHHMCLVISPTAKIGNNCNLSQFTTIGSNHGLAAVIGDDVYIGPSVCIVENVNIGSGCTIGAGAVVVTDVPENSTVAGNPAKVISYKTAGRYIGNKWKS